MTSEIHAKAVDRYNVLHDARNELLPGIFEAKAEVDRLRSAFELACLHCDVSEFTLEPLRLRRVRAETALDSKIQKFVDRHRVFRDACDDLKSPTTGRPQ